jgi:hypothetical protein
MEVVQNFEVMLGQMLNQCAEFCNFVSVNLMQLFSIDMITT